MAIAQVKRVVRTDVASLWESEGERKGGKSRERKQVEFSQVGDFATILCQIRPISRPSPSSRSSK